VAVPLDGHFVFTGGLVSGTLSTQKAEAARGQDILARFCRSQMAGLVFDLESRR
jgi:hypothetical protein